MQLNNFQPVPQPAVQAPTPSSTGETSAHHRKSAYAAMRDLQERFHLAGIDTDQVWEYFKAEHRVDSRSKLTGMQWARISCNLQSARREASLFKILVDSIPDTYFRIHVFASDPNVCIPRPRDLKKHHIPGEWFDFQAFADDNQCTITVSQGTRTTYYKPAIKPAKVEVTTPQKPLFAMDTNAHGEVLNVFGDVVGVRA